jgi:hypothetical protein
MRRIVSGGGFPPILPSGVLRFSFDKAQAAQKGGPVVDMGCFALKTLRLLSLLGSLVNR